VINTETKILIPTSYGNFWWTPSSPYYEIDTLLESGTLQPGKDYALVLAHDPIMNRIELQCKDITTNTDIGANSRVIGGFHTLCVSAGSDLTYSEGGTTKQHPLNGYLAGDILPQSVWCLNHRPHSKPKGMVYIPSRDFWCDIYLQSGNGANTKSIYKGAPTRSRQYVDHVEDMFCIKKTLLNDEEFAAAMLGSNEQTNIAGSVIGSVTSGGVGGKSDTKGRRMISIYGVEEGCGSLWQWLATTSAGGVEGTIQGQISTTPTFGFFSMTLGNSGYYGQAGGKGKLFGLCGSISAGGAYSSGSNGGSRSRAADYSRSLASDTCCGRGCSHTIRNVPDFSETII
jgi:hypothetical protein